MSYFLGIDIGGTKSHALICDRAGNLLGFGSGGAGNHEIVGYPGLQKVLREITDEALQSAGLVHGDLAGAGFGVAGYDWPSERAQTLAAISTLGLSCPVEAVNDAFLGLLAGASEGWGVSVVAGTGENCWGRDRSGRIGRVTGNGLMLGEFGGAGTIVARAVVSVTKAWCRRGPETQLTEVFREHTRSTSTAELIEKIGLGQARLGARAAPLVVRTAEMGDSVAIEILTWSGRELADLAAGVIRQLSFEDIAFDVVQVGSMFGSSEIIAGTFKKEVLRVAPAAEFVRLEAPPVIGAVLLAMEKAGVDPWSARPQMIEACGEVV